MTLIAAVRAEDGIAICADSQETVGEYRRSVQKIAPLKFGLLELVLAGAGNGDLIDSFIEVFSRSLGDANIHDLAQFVEHFEAILTEFYAMDVEAAECKDLILFVAASIPTKRVYQVWVAKHLRLKPLDKADLIGWDEMLYYRTLNSHVGIGVAQAVLTAIHTVTVAEETSNYVRSPFSVAVVNSNGIALEDPAYVQILHDRLLVYENRLNSVFLACADTSLPKNSLEERLSEFAKEAIQLHQSHMVQAVQHQIATLIKGKSSGDAYPKIPLGTRISARLTRDGPEIVNSEYKVLVDDETPDNGDTK